MNAYHDDATMSMHMAYPEWCGNVQGAEKLSEYMVRFSQFCIIQKRYQVKHFCLAIPTSIL